MNICPHSILSYPGCNCFITSFIKLHVICSTKIISVGAHCKLKRKIFLTNVIIQNYTCKFNCIATRVSINVPNWMHQSHTLEASCRLLRKDTACRLWNYSPVRCALEDATGINLEPIKSSPQPDSLFLLKPLEYYPPICSLGIRSGKPCPP